MAKYLAVDIGASSGRIFEAVLAGGKIELREVFRFEEYLKYEENSYFWDIEKIYGSIISGLKKYFGENREEGQSIGIDTWGVDFVLLDSRDNMLGKAVSYRDSRTNGMMEKFFDIMEKEKIYEKTGIQFMEFNTLFQLYALGFKKKELLEKAESFLMIPDYLNYLLTDEKVNEITNVSTTQMMNYKTGFWDEEIVKILNFEKIKNTRLGKAGDTVGNIKSGVQKELGIKKLAVILPGTHDTASAVAAVPHFEEEGAAAYISSGTWSLMGIESEYIVNEKSYKLNFTNEADVKEKKSRFLKNIMGLWLIQRIKKEYNNEFSFSEIVKLSKSEKDFSSLINPNDKRFLNPENMRKEICAYCLETNQKAPENIGQFGKLIFYSLALLYAKTLEELKELSGLDIKSINIIGGGSQNEYLNQLTSDAAEVRVTAGPVEATVLGNVIVQAYAGGEISSLEEGRKIIKNSFGLKEYYPEKSIKELYDKFLKLY
jgi:rhamnulokinase